MKHTKTLITILAMVAAASSASQIRDVTDEAALNSGTILQSYSDKTTKTMTVSTSLHTFVFDTTTPHSISPSSAKKTYTHQFKVGDKSIRGNSLQTVMVGNYVLTNIQGVEVHCYDTTSDSAEPAWVFRPDQESIRAISLADGAVLVAGTKTLNKLDISNGNVVKSIQAGNIAKMVEVKESSGNFVVALTRTGLVKYNPANLEVVSQVNRDYANRMWTVRDMKGFEGRDLLVVNYATFESTLEVLDTADWTVVNSIEHLHAFFQIETLEGISGTQMAISSAGDRNMLIFNLIEMSNWPQVVRRVNKEFTSFAMGYSQGTTEFAYFYSKQSTGDTFFKVADVCVVKNCEICEDNQVSVCKKCERGTVWNADKKECEIQMITIF